MGFRSILTKKHTIQLHGETSLSVGVMFVPVLRMGRVELSKDWLDMIFFSTVKAGTTYNVILIKYWSKNLEVPTGRRSIKKSLVKLLFNNSLFSIELSNSTSQLHIKQIHHGCEFDSCVCCSTVPVTVVIDTFLSR